MPAPLTTLHPRTGIADGFTVLPPREATPLWQVIVQLRRRPGFRPSPPGALALVGASDLSRRRAAERAAGEAVERAALLPGPEDREDRRDGLVDARSPLDGSSVELPLTDLLYDAESGASIPPATVEERTPSGAAAGGALADAVSSALLELVERDALVVAWARQLAVAHVDLQPLPRARDAIARLRDPDRHGGGRLVVADLGCDVPGVHAIVALCLRPASGAAAVGAKAAIDRESAVIGAAQEAVQALHLATSMRSAGLGGTPSLVRTESDRAILWASDAALDTLLGWVETFEPASARRVPISPRAAGSVPELLGRAGLRPRVVDLTDRLTGPARGLGWHAVKAVCPELQPLRIDEGLEESWRPDRLLSAEARTGYRSPLGSGEVCDVPHPLV